MYRQLKANLSLGPVSRAVAILSKRDKQKFFLVILIQIFFGFVDLVGVALVGVLGALAVSGIESKNPGERVSVVLRIFH